MWGVARFISDDPYEVLKMSSFGTAFNFDGIWGGNMYAGGSGAILPNKITSKHSIRYVPDMNSGDILKKIRTHLDSHGYKDVQVRLIGDQPWSTMDFDTDVARSVEAMFDKFGIPWNPPISKTNTMDAMDTNWRRRVARVSVYERQAGRSGDDAVGVADRGRQRGLWWTRACGERVLGDRGRGQGVRHGRCGEVDRG